MSKINLDNLEQIKKLDKNNMLGSLELLGKQVEQIWETAKKIKVPSSYKNVKNVVVLGMGGSALGPHIMKSVFSAELTVPVEIVGGYHVPGYVNKDSLVLLSSYSGTTEEVLFSMKEAKARDAKLLTITAGGELAEWSEANNVPSLIFSTENNPSGQPRMGQGYMIVGPIVLLSKAGLLKLSENEIEKVLTVFAKYDREFGVFNLEKNNIVKQDARQVLECGIWYVGAEHLAGNAHTAANQMDETAKRFAGYHLIPELNHHLLEGMLYPKANSKYIMFIFIESSLYSERVQKRFEVTKKVLEKNKIEYISYKCQEKNKLNQACEVLAFGSYFSFYSALLEGIDPTPVPYVDFFKEQLKK